MSQQPQDKQRNNYRQRDEHSAERKGYQSANSNKDGRKMSSVSQQRRQEPTSSQVQEAIIDLYLQVKIRSHDEIDIIEPDQLQDERGRLRKLNSLTVLDYIKTQIEILMQMKLEDEKETLNENKPKLKHDRFGGNDNGACSEFTSTFQSIDLPPKEYEQQLQQYEAEVRNHIKVEQQLKLHIEVLQEKIDDLEKDKKEFDFKLNQQKSKHDQKLAGYKKIVESRQLEVEKLKKDLSKQREFVNASLERSRDMQTGPYEKPQGHEGSRSQVKQVRVNNFTVKDKNSSNRGNATSHSPSGLGSSSTSSKESVNIIGGIKVKKGLKVVNINGKVNPYINNSFLNKGAINQTSASSNPGDSSAQSSAKANRKGAASAEISESSMIKIKPSSNKNGGITTISNGSVQKVDNKQLIAAIQRMQKKQQTGTVLNQSKNSTATNESLPIQTHNIDTKVVNVAAPASNSHKKNSKSQAQNSSGQVIKQVSNPASKITTSVLQRDGKKLTNQQAHYNSIGTAERNREKDDKLSEQSQSTVIQNQNQLMTSQQSSTATQKQQHQSSIESGNNNMVLTQTNLQGSGNLNSSFKKVNSSSGKPGIRTQSGRSGTVVTEKIATSSSVKKANSSRKQAQVREIGPGMKQDSRSLQNQKMMGHVNNSIQSHSHMNRKSTGENESMGQHFDSNQILDQSENAMAPFNMRQNDFMQSKRAQQDSHGMSNFSNDSTQPNMGAANQQDVINSFQHSSHGYHHSSNNSNINWHPHQGHSQQIHSAQHPSNKIRNSSVIHANSQSQNAQQQPIQQHQNYNQMIPDPQTNNYMTNQDSNQLKNQRKVGMVQRSNYRPRSQTGHQNGRQTLC